MRRSLLLLSLYAGMLALTGAPHAIAQSTEQVPTEKEISEFDRVGKWKILNTAIFVIGLGYFLAKYSPRFFNARSADIQKAIQDATGLKLEADYRYSEIDRKMATLAEEVKKLREQAAVELEREHEKLQQDTQAEIEHIHRNILAEIDALRAEGTRQVKRHTAEMALALAERRLQDRLAAGGPDTLVRDFIHLVERGKN